MPSTIYKNYQCHLLRLPRLVSSRLVSSHLIRRSATAAPLSPSDRRHRLAAKAAKPSNDALKEKSTKANLSRSFTDPEKFVEEIVEKTSAIVLSEINEETIKQHGEQLGALVSNSIKKHLSLDLINLARLLCYIAAGHNRNYTAS